MRSTEHIFSLLITVVLGYATFIGHAFLGAYLTGHLPHALFLSGIGLVILPGLGSALVTGFLLAAVGCLVTPRFVIVVPMLATVPWATLHIWAWIVYGSSNIWWVVASDITLLVLATYAFAILFRRLRPRLPPNSSFKADASGAA